MDSESKKIFRVTATRVNGRWCVWESDIEGLFFEADSIPEMKECIESISPKMLMKNHKLQETDLASVEVRVTIKSDVSKPEQRSGKAKFVYDEDTQQKKRPFLQYLFLGEYEKGKWYELSNRDWMCLVFGLVLGLIVFLLTKA